MTEVADAIARNCDRGPQRARHSSAARRIGSNGSGTEKDTPTR